MRNVLSFLAVGGLLWAATAQAGPRSGGNYSVATDVLDAGGRKSTSANYSNNGGIGSIGAIATGSPSETSRGGYIGQLYDITGLTLGAATTNLFSGSNLLVRAVLRLDDNTLLPVAATQVVWSVANGPISSINATGLVTAAAVSTNTPATVRGDSFGQTATLPLLVLAVSGGNSIPGIVQFTINGNKLVLGGTNGTAGHNFYILTSTNMALPLANWTVMATNSFDPSGNFNCTNTITTGSTPGFFILRVP
ncbi:MAG TPA: hypothetical protein VN625_00680 [Desulfuromonadaceae bacterium]|nr:hypothetical protein [Desulfuromonadaceae bacterium]